jgi:parallel beta-helix repeat protein
MGVDGSGRDHVFQRVQSNDNGQMGWGASCSGCLFEDGTAMRNNWKGYDPFWEAGGGKWNGTTQTVIRRHYAADNHGPGIWLDGDNASNTIEDCLVVNNQVAGIMLELNTTQTLVQNNVITGTRWLEWSGSGILSQAASHNVLLRNTIEGNEGTGMWLRLDPLRRALDGHNTVWANLIVGNAANRSVEAREVSLEGETIEHVRSNRFDHNVYGSVSGDPVLRSAFFVFPTANGDLRGNQLGAWRRAIRGDRDAIQRSNQSVPSRVIPAPTIHAGADQAAIRGSGGFGADRSRVRTMRSTNDS